MPTISFETPENIVVEYNLAGPGTRYVAFIIDMLLLILSGILISLMVIFGLLALESTGAGITGDAAAVLVAVGIVVFGFASIAYFVLFELFMGGQTPGKRMTRIRVVNEHGFSLHSGAIILRGIFRIIDVVPVLWIVPLLSQKFQRFGDMAAGTLVVEEQSESPHAIREQLAARSAVDAEFRFSPAQLDALDEPALETLETFLARREEMSDAHRFQLGETIANGAAGLIGADPPPQNGQELFIEELLAAYARREARQIA